jgi:hypothetical protein
MQDRNLLMVGVFLLLLLPFGCGGALETTKSTMSGMTSLVVSEDVDEKLYAQVPAEKKSAVAELMAKEKLAQKRLDLARAVVEQKEAELELAESMVEVVEAEKEEAEIEVGLAKMRAVQSSNLGDPKKVNTQVAKIEAKQFEQKATLAKLKAEAENARLTLEEQKKEVKKLEEAIK